jgi:hypothetical protein
MKQENLQDKMDSISSYFLSSEVIVVHFHLKTEIYVCLILAPFS